MREAVSVVATNVLQSIRQDGKTKRVKRALGEQPLLVSRLGQQANRPCLPGRIEKLGAEGIGDNAAEEVGLGLYLCRLCGVSKLSQLVPVPPVRSLCQSSRLGGEE